MMGAKAATPQHEVKPAAAVLSEDVICQSFVQGSSTLAYACLLIRRKHYDLASHVLHSLEAKQALRFKDMVFYLQAQIGIETGEFGTAKRRLVPRIHQHPNDAVALSLLEACIYLEYETWERAQPERIWPDRKEEPITVKQPLQPASNPAYPGDLPAILTPADSKPSGPAHSPNPDIGPFQSLMADPHTQAVVLWNPKFRRLRPVSRKRELEALLGLIPYILPDALADSCRALDGGEIHKVCVCFQNLTVSSFHGGYGSLGLVTGSLTQSLLTLVRAENIFLKYAPVDGSREEAGAEPQAMEFVPNE